MAIFGLIDDVITMEPQGLKLLLCMIVTYSTTTVQIMPTFVYLTNVPLAATLYGYLDIHWLNTNTLMFLAHYISKQALFIPIYSVVINMLKK